MAAPSPLKELVCGICLADLLSEQGGAELGELDSCAHRQANMWEGQSVGTASDGARLGLQVTAPAWGCIRGPNASAAELAGCCLLSVHTPHPSPHSSSFLLLCPRFCYPCISKWAEIENSCPFCKQRFGQLRRKRLPPARALVGADAAGELPGTYMDCTTVEERNQASGCVGMWEWAR